MAYERITVDPGQMGGLPCIRGLRVTVSAVVGQLAAGRSIEDLLDDFPYLEREDVLAALEYAAAAVSERELPLAQPAGRRGPGRVTRGRGGCGGAAPVGDWAGPGAWRRCRQGGAAL